MSTRFRQTAPAKIPATVIKSPNFPPYSTDGKISPKTAAANSDALRYYVRGNCDSWLQENTSESWEGAVITKPVSVARMHAWLKEHPEAFIAALAE